MIELTKLELDDGSVQYLAARGLGWSLLHREDGPAVEWAGGGIVWYLMGEQLTFEEWLIRSTATDEEKVMLKLKYG